MMLFLCCKVNTNLSAFDEICSAQDPPRKQSKFVKCFMSPNLIPLPPQKTHSCQENITQLSTDVTFHVGKEECNLQKKKKKSKFTSA